MIYTISIIVFLVFGWALHSWGLKIRLRRQAFTIAFQQAEIAALKKAGTLPATADLVPESSYSPRVRLAAGLAALAALTLVSLADYLTGYELLLFSLYFVPVVICVWYLGRSAAALMSVACGFAWWIVDRWSGHGYTDEGIRFWNAFTCFLSVAIVGWMLNRLKAGLAEQERLSRDLAATLLQIGRSNEEIRKLQNELQIVCAWTKRIQVDGEWVPMEEYLRTQLQNRFSHGMSPEAQKSFLGDSEDSQND